MAARLRGNPSRLFFSLDPEHGFAYNNKTDFLIDEFKVWAEPKTEFDIR